MRKVEVESNEERQEVLEEKSAISMVQLKFSSCKLQAGDLAASYHTDVDNHKIYAPDHEVAAGKMFPPSYWLGDGPKKLVCSCFL